MSIPEITLIIITHYSPKEEYGQSKPPSDYLVSKTYDSIRREFSHFERNVTEKILVYNRPRNFTNDSIAYDHNLETFCKDNNFLYVKTPNEGLREALRLSLSLAENKLILFVEHDWEFVSKIDTDNLLHAISRPGINLINFSTRKIDARQTEKSISYSNFPYVTPKLSFGNGSYIVKKDYLINLIKLSEPTLNIKFVLGAIFFKPNVWTLGFFLRIIRSKFPSFAGRIIPLSVFDSKYQYVWPYLNNMEFVLDTYYKTDMYLRGVDEAHKRWGIYWYGDINDGPYMVHQGR